MNDRPRFPSRRGILASAACTGLVLAIDDGFAQSLAPTPACHDGDEPTLPETEGPFFKPRSPQRSDLREPGLPGRPVELSGRVLTRACRPVAGAIVDLWQADDAGEYDNKGFRLRGHVFTDSEGRYTFRTIVPGLYPGRTRHFHAKIQAAESAAAHHAILLSRRAAQSHRCVLPSRAGDAGRVRRGYPTRAVRCGAGDALALWLPAWRRTVPLDRGHDFAVTALIPLHAHRDDRVQRRQQQQRMEDEPKDQAQHEEHQVEDGRERLAVEQ